MVDGVVVPELNETVGDGGDGDDDAVPRPVEVIVDRVSSAKDRLAARSLSRSLGRSLPSIVFDGVARRSSVFRPAIRPHSRARETVSFDEISGG